ncbi:protein CDI-like protein [Cinnamomum micranthum f. kanehirae]|uniref:Protein CDI-like protein n=1 Tax=Cinnamomum micranthum f. kanehirae TaxID=337451 RepID=A0A443NRE6_9MAGN|nr:protein CDI-like protein [Cinnamomum micranthum f. kanehirae]
MTWLQGSRHSLLHPPLIHQPVLWLPISFTSASTQIAVLTQSRLSSLPTFVIMSSNVISKRNGTVRADEIRSAHANGNGKQSDTFKIFIGYDPREDLAYEVCKYSILKRSSIPVEVHPIKQPDLREKGLYWRERGSTESTEFSFTRFLTPFLADFRGWAMFVDCDFLYTADIKELTDLIDDRYALMCVHHDYTPKDTTKMDGVVQTVYPRKNWSSMVLYNCGHPKNRILMPELVSSQTGAFLHRFMWLEDDEIGSVPFAWNFLVGHNRVDEDDPSTKPKAIHYTSGGPWFDGWKSCDFADMWIKEMEEYKKEAGFASDL